MSTIPRLARSLPCWLALPSLVACGADSLKPPPVTGESSGVYWSLTLNHSAVTMGPRAPYDTLTIIATPRNAAGDVLTALPAPTYVSRDPTTVTVTPEGLVHVTGSDFAPVWVIATLVTGNVRHVDSVRVRSVDPGDSPPVLTTFSIKPVPPDSAKVALEFFASSVPVHAADADGMPITDPMVSFRSLNPQLAMVDEVTGGIKPVGVGDVAFTASTTMFGVTKVDTVHYRIGWPLFGQAIFFPEHAAFADTFSFRVGVGALVIWASPVSRPEVIAEGFRIDFDDADLPNIKEAAASILYPQYAFFCSNPPPPLRSYECANGGNVVVTPPDIGAMRTFTAPGTYYYHLSPSGVTGRIDVVDER